MNPLISDQGLVIFGSLISGGIALAGFLLGYWRNRSGSNGPQHGWSAVKNELAALGRKAGGALSRLDKLEPIPAHVDELLVMIREQKAASDIQSERLSAHIEDTREIKRRLERP